MKKKLALITAGLIFIFSFSLCRQTGKTETAALYLNHADSVRYTGISSCQPCHADKYETFLQTGMGRSFGPAGLKRSSASFVSVKPVYDRWLDLYYLPRLIDGRIHILEYRLQGSDTVHSRLEEIHYIIGSGHHTNSHLTQNNGYVFQAPLTFYTQKGKWDLPPGFENGNNTRFSRKIGMECMSCHNAMPEPVSGSENRYENLPHGISCERCHGPGEIHIREMQQGRALDVSKVSDYSIVNPRKLSWQRQIDICQRCHLQGNAVLKPGKDFSSFRPGMVLSETFDQFSPEYEDGDDLVMAAHAERFQKSKCFISSVSGDLKSAEARVGFTCISCHNPHVSVRQTQSLQFNNTCKGCHQGSEKTSCSADAKSIEANKNNCVACHMPASGTSDIPHVSVHDHYIRKPSASGIQKPGRLKGLRCITSDSPDKLTLTEAYVSYFEKFEQNPLYLEKARENGKSLDARIESHFQTLVHLAYTSGDFKGLTRLSKYYSGKSDAWTAYRLGKAYENTGNSEKAAFYLSDAVVKEPGNLDFILQYAVLEIRLGHWQNAEKLLKGYNHLYPKTAETWAYLGLTAMQSTRYSEAKQHFLRALKLDPDQLLALSNLKTLYGMLGDNRSAGETEKRIQTIQNRKKP